MKPRIFVTRRWPAAVEARLSEHFDTVLNTGDKPLDASEFRAALASYDAVRKFWQTMVLGTVILMPKRRQAIIL